MYLNLCSAKYFCTVTTEWMHENLWQSPTTVKWIWLTCWYRFSNWLTVNCSGKTTSCMTGGGSGLGERNTFNSYMGKKNQVQIQSKYQIKPNISQDQYWLQGKTLYFTHGVDEEILLLKNQLLFQFLPFLNGKANSFGHLINAT